MGPVRAHSRGATGRERLGWAAVAAAAVVLLLLPGAGLSPASGRLASGGPLAALRLALALPVLALGLGVAPVRLLRLLEPLPGAALGLVVAPLAWAVSGAVMTREGGDFAGAGRLALLAAGVLSAGAALRVRQVPGAAAGSPPAVAVPRGFVIAVAAWTAGVAVLLLANPILAWRSDAWFHAAVTYRLDAVGWPPDDPYYVGAPLGYFWAYHLALGTLAGAAGATPFAAGAGLSVTAALAAALWLGLLARDLCGRAAMAPAVAIAVLGLNPLGWLGWLARTVVDGLTRGPSPAPPWQDGALGGLAAVDLGYPHPGLGFFPEKFLLVTALGLGLAAGLAFAWVAFSGRAPSGWRAAVAAGLGAAVAFFLHAVLGVGLLAFGAAGLAVAWIMGAGRRAFAVAAGLAAAAALALPYAAACSLGRVEPVLRWGASPGMPWAWIVSGGAVTGLAVVGLAGRRAWSATDGDAIDAAGGLAGLAAAVAVLVLLSIATTMAGHNEIKFFHLGATLLAVPAAGGWVRLGGARAGRVARATLCTLCLPTAALALSGFVTERGQGVAGRPVPTAEEAEAYEWLSVNAGARAGVLEATRADLEPVSRDVPVHARRGLVWGGPAHAALWGYAAQPMRERAELARALGEGRCGPQEEARLDELAKLGARELYAVSRRASSADGPRAAARTLPLPWIPVFRNRSVTIHRWGEDVPRWAGTGRP